MRPPIATGAHDAVIDNQWVGVFATKRVRNDLLNDGVGLREDCQVGGKIPEPDPARGTHLRLHGGVIGAINAVIFLAIGWTWAGDGPESLGKLRRIAASFCGGIRTTKVLPFPALFEVPVVSTP